MYFYSQILIYLANQAPSSMLPLGMETTLDNLEPLKVLPSHDMRYLIVGISYAKTVDELLETNIAGLLHMYAI